MDNNTNTEVLNNEVQANATEQVVVGSNEPIEGVRGEVGPKGEAGETLYTKAEMQSYHSKKMNDFIKKFDGATSFDDVVKQVEAIKTNNSDLAAKHKEQEDKFTSLEKEFANYKEEQYYNTLGLDESQQKDFKGLMEQRLTSNPELNRDEVATELLDKYFKPKSIKMGTEKTSGYIPKTEDELDKYRAESKARREQRY